MTPGKNPAGRGSDGDNLADGGAAVCCVANRFALAPKRSSRARRELYQRNARPPMAAPSAAVMPTPSVYHKAMKAIENSLQVKA